MYLTEPVVGHCLNILQFVLIAYTTSRLGSFSAVFIHVYRQSTL